MDHVVLIRLTAVAAGHKDRPGVGFLPRTKKKTLDISRTYIYIYVSRRAAVAFIFRRRGFIRTHEIVADSSSWLFEEREILHSIHII